MQDPEQPQRPGGSQPPSEPETTGSSAPPEPDTTSSSLPPEPAPPPAAAASAVPEPAEPPAAAASATGYASAAATPTATAERPLGITIIAILAAIAGVFGIFGGLLLLVGGSFIGVASGSAGLGALAALIGALLLGAAILNLVFAWGAWGLKAWAWTLGVGLQAVSIVLGLFNLINGDGGAIISLSPSPGSSPTTCSDPR